MKKTNSPKFGKIFRILAASGLACAISISGQFPASVAAQSTSVNSIPPECLDDNGVALTPDLSSGWLFLVNFNVPVLGGVRGCMVQSNASGQINRTGFMCSTMGSVDVANGNAVLNGAGYFLVHLIFQSRQWAARFRIIIIGCGRVFSLQPRLQTACKCLYLFTPAQSCAPRETITRSR